MRVDQTGCDDPAARVDDAFRRCAAGLADIDDAVAGDLDVAGQRRGVGAGIDRAAAHDDIDRRRCGGRGERDGGDGEQRADHRRFSSGASVARDTAAASTAARLNGIGCIALSIHGAY